MNIQGFNDCRITPTIRVLGGNRFVYILVFQFVLFMAATGIAYADGLFDFQMKLANKGNVEAQFKIGEMYENGFGVEENFEEALKWITKAADQGHETAGFKLLYYDIRKNGINKNNKARYDELNSKANAGNGQAQYYVGLLYANGVGVKQDADKASEWLGKASLVGVTAAESEITKLRENAQRAKLEQRREADQRKAREEAKRKEEERKRLEAKRETEQAEKQKEAEMRARAEKARAKAAEQKSRDEDERARQLAQRQAQEREKEQRRQALLEERKKKEQVKKEQFESDPCSGKSARFLSTCR